MFDMFSILGKVKATVNGHKKLLKLEIDPEIFSDKDVVQDLTVAAVNKAISDIDAQVKAELAKSMEGVIPNIPGLDLNALMGGMR